MRLRTAYVFALLLTLTACQTTGEKRELPREANKIAELNMQLGIAYFREGQMAVALKKLLRAVEFDPGYADAYSALGLVYDRLGESDKAGRYFKRAVKLEPTNSEAANNYGQYLCARGQIEEAERLFQQALSNPLYRTPEYALTNAGKCALRNQDPDQAETYFREALQRAPTFTVALWNMARLSYDKQQYLSARAYLSRYNEIGKPTPQTLWLGIQIENELGDKDASSSYAILLKGKFPDAPETRLLLESEQRIQ